MYATPVIQHQYECAIICKLIFEIGLFFGENIWTASDLNDRFAYVWVKVFSGAMNSHWYLKEIELV